MKRLGWWLMAAVLALATGIGQAADLPLGPGDVVKVAVYGNADLGVETRVSESGAITFPLLGQVAVGGLSTSAAEKKISQLLESGGFVRKAQVNVVVTQAQSQQVSVLGQVNRPGRYPLEGKHDLMDLLAAAGGIAADGGDTVNWIRKRDSGTTKEVIDVVLLVRSAQFNQDYTVSANDVIYVERAPRFYIYGEVQRPGSFRLERDMTVVQALSVGGGLTPRGTERGVRVKRRGASGKLEVVEVKFDDLLQADDVVYVKESLF